MAEKASKYELILEIASLLEVPPPKMSTGSTEPKQLFELINDLLGLGISPDLQKPQMARQIVELSGGIWPSEGESTGGTVTRVGLKKVLEAVVFFTNSGKNELEV